MRPHPQYLDDFFSLYHLVNQPVLDIDASGIGACQVADQLFVRRRGLERISRYDIEEANDFTF